MPVNYNDVSLDDEAEDGYSDLVFEKQVSLAQQATYFKMTRRVLSETGVENLSQVSVTYEPSYQQLVFHSIQVIRGNQVINKLDLSKIKTLQKEQELDRSIYNGSLTAMLILEDLRKDDILEYSYTIKGFNPVFNNKFSGTLLTRFSVPVYNIYYKIIAPSERNLQVKNFLTDIKPDISMAGNQRVYEWKLQNQAGLRLEDNLPSWYDVYPAIMIGEMATWKEINDWALTLFPSNPPLSAGLRQKVEEIKGRYNNDEDRTLAALRFVQDDVRYMGIEMGENSHKPHSPSQVLQQRFGDCKDKAYLLCTLLTAMGIEAYPVLINTSYKKTIDTWLPSPVSFDHTTATAIVNGKQYWFDATISHQRGKLKDISFPDYQVGLVIKPGTTSLTKIPLQNTGRVHTREVFYVRHMDKPVKFVVTTKFTGSHADRTRQSFKSNSKKELLKGYMDLYTSYFKKIDADSLSYKDNEETGEFTTIEYYTVHDFWKHEDGKQKASLQPFLIYSVIRTPDDERRKHPFALSYPARYTEDIEIHLPKDWPAEESSHYFTPPGCKIEYEYSRPSSDLILLHYTYENTADHIQPDETAAYVREIENAEQGIAYELTSGLDVTNSSPSTFNTNSSNVFNALYLILGLCVMATYLYKRNNRQDSRWN